MLSRKPVSDLVISTLQLWVNKPVGDADAPDVPYGWNTQAGANSSSFIPYLVVYPNFTNKIAGPLANTHADIHLPYSITGYGVSRGQCEWILDKSRDALDSLQGVGIDLNDGLYRVSSIEVESIGSINRSGDEDYPYFGETDVVSLFVSKEHPL